MKKELLPLDHHGIGFDLKYVYKIYKIRCPRNARFRGAMGGFAAAHRRCLVGISARVLLVVPVPVLVPVVLLAVGVRQHEQSRKHFSPHIRVCPKIYVGHEPRTTVEFPFNRKDSIYFTFYYICALPIVRKPTSGSPSGYSQLSW